MKISRDHDSPGDSDLPSASSTTRADSPAFPDDARAAARSPAVTKPRASAASAAIMPARSPSHDAVWITAKAGLTTSTPP